MAPSGTQMGAAIGSLLIDTAFLYLNHGGSFEDAKHSATLRAGR